jgi:hypothetical protein
MPCKMCSERGQTWRGSPPRCGFGEDGKMVEENWNCATINAIRDICYEGQNDMPPGVDYRYCDDQKYATIDLHRMDGLDDRPLAMWVTWYKSRGETEGVWLMFDDQPPRRPTEAECLSIIDHYSRWVKPAVPMTPEDMVAMMEEFARLDAEFVWEPSQHPSDERNDADDAIPF